MVVASKQDVSSDVNEIMSVKFCREFTHRCVVSDAISPCVSKPFRGGLHDSVGFVLYGTNLVVYSETPHGPLISNFLVLCGHRCRLHIDWLYRGRDKGFTKNKEVKSTFQWNKATRFSSLDYLCSVG